MLEFLISGSVVWKMKDRFASTVQMDSEKLMEVAKLERNTVLSMIRKENAKNAITTIHRFWESVDITVYLDVKFRKQIIHVVNASNLSFLKIITVLSLTANL